MGYTLTSFFLILSKIITGTNGLSVNISPIPASVIAGDKLLITSTITKEESEPWRAFTFYVINEKATTPCGGAPNKSPSACIDNFGCSPYGFGFTCNYTHFNLFINNVNTSLLGWSIYAEVSISGGSNKKSDSTNIEIKIPLEGVSLTPNGTITKQESETIVFRCFARSLPLANLSWHLSGSLLPTSSPPVTTTDTVTSTYTYTAQKDDNGKMLSCTAVYDSTPSKEEALINVLYRPIVTANPNNDPYRVLENTTNMQMTCIVTDANPAVISFIWKKDDSTISRTANYTIPTVHRSQAGSYTCGATNSVGSSNPSAVIRLEVLYVAEITTISKNEPIEGTKLSHTCNVQSYPVVRKNDVTWTKQNNSTFNMNGKQLIIDNVNKLDSGIYVCTVVIQLVPAEGQPLNVTRITTVEVDVLYRPEVTITPNYTQYKVIENSTNIELYCTMTDANPAVSSYRWYKDGIEIDGSTNASYTISTVQRSHTGSYTCDATNSVASSEPSSVVNLYVLYGVDIDPIDKENPIEFTKLSISCKVDSYPEVTNNDVKWTKQNNASFSKKGQQLEINAIHRTDSGTYVCTVLIELTPTIGQSVYVTGSTTVKVNVLYRPTVTIYPDNNQNVIENTTNVQLTCNVTDANPAVTSYRWYKASSVISNAISYTISAVNRSHTGSYTCAATNTVGTSNPSVVVQLNVLYGVELYPINKHTQTEGDILKINCSGKSNPAMSTNDVKWSKKNNNTFSSEGLQLVIDNVNRIDRGTYVCSVILKLTPTVGQPINVTGTTTANVDVLYRPDVTVSPDINPYHVVENTTNQHLTCNVTDANPAVTSYRWYKDGVKISTAGTYTIPKVYRSHTGSYTCDAINTVGSSDHSSVLQLDVLYGVSLNLPASEICINETERWDLTCIGDGNPLPKLTFAYRYNSTNIGEQTANETSIIVDNANCVDTGLYVCSGNNTIGEPVSQSANITVACKPRTNTNVDKKDIFINGTDENLNISITFISYPLSKIVWYRELPDGNLTDIDSGFLISTMSSHLPYETISVLQKDQLKQDEFGIYIVKASNSHGSFLLKYNLIPKRKPDPPTNIKASCDVTSITVTWISSFNGGENQTFRIKFLNKISNKTTSKEGITDKGRNEIHNEEKESLSPDTLYWISVESENVYGTVNSTETANCTTTKNQEDDQYLSSALIGGITGSISAVLIVVIVIVGLYWWRRRQVPGKETDLIKRHSKETDEEEEGLKENPLYVTSGDESTAKFGPVYGVVNKQKKKENNTIVDDNIDQRPVYSEVQKSNIQGKKKQKEKKARIEKNEDSYQDIELGTVYENSDKLLIYKSSDELYANAEEQMTGINLAKVNSPKKNKDGLIYADLDMIPTSSGKKFIIRGLENRTNYAIIDLSKTAEPLPSDDDEEDKGIGNMKSPDNEGNG